MTNERRRRVPPGVPPRVHRKADEEGSAVWANCTARTGRDMIPAEFLCDLTHRASGAVVVASAQLKEAVQRREARLPGLLLAPACRALHPAAPLVRFQLFRSHRLAPAYCTIPCGRQVRCMQSTFCQQLAGPAAGKKKRYWLGVRWVGGRSTVEFTVGLNGQPRRGRDPLRAAGRVALR